MATRIEFSKHGGPEVLQAVADSCARRGLRALWRGRRCIVPDWWNRVWIPLCKILPMWALRPVRRFTMKFQK